MADSSFMNARWGRNKGSSARRQHLGGNTLQRAQQFSKNLWVPLPSPGSSLGVKCVQFESFRPYRTKWTHHTIFILAFIPSPSRHPSHKQTFSSQFFGWWQRRYLRSLNSSGMMVHWTDPWWGEYQWTTLEHVLSDSRSPRNLHCSMRPRITVPNVWPPIFEKLEMMRTKLAFYWVESPSEKLRNILSHPRKSCLHEQKQLAKIWSWRTLFRFISSTTPMKNKLDSLLGKFQEIHFLTLPSARTLYRNRYQCPRYL